MKAFGWFMLALGIGAAVGIVSGSPALGAVAFVLVIFALGAI
jgi:hypothetical protein